VIDIVITEGFELEWENLGMTQNQLDNLEEFLVQNPEAGDIIRGTGGMRKLRWKLNNNKGKSGGQRCIYIYYNSFEKLYLITTYPKSEKENLTELEKQQLKELSKQIKKVLSD
jgi:hypothetical protein